jgi:hypothetical protein
MLRDSLGKIVGSLCVSTMFMTIARAYDKEFNLAMNYPKGHGEFFCGMDEGKLSRRVVVSC